MQRNICFIGFIPHLLCITNIIGVFNKNFLQRFPFKISPIATKILKIPSDIFTWRITRKFSSLFIHKEIWSEINHLILSFIVLSPCFVYSHSIIHFINNHYYHPLICGAFTNILSSATIRIGKSSFK